MLGSSQSISGPNVILNTIVAEELKQFADVLEKSDDFNSDLKKLIQSTLKNHSRIIFNGDGYSEEWQEEAAKRGLLNLKTTVDALPQFIAEKNIKLFTDHKIFTRAEMMSRYEILMETYVKVLNIEALTMIDMVKKDILPSVSKYVEKLSATVISVKSVNHTAACKAETSLIEKLSALNDETYDSVTELEKLLEKAEKVGELLEVASYYRDSVIPCMEKLRKSADTMEENMASNLWPYPSYGDLLFRV